MPPAKKFIRDLSEPTGPYFIRAKVIDKMSVHCTEEAGPLLHQIITFQDEEGTEMQALLENKQLEMFDDAIEDYMEYDIFNAALEIAPDRITGPEAKLYAIVFSINTIIKLVISSIPWAEPKYMLIASIPRTITLDDRYDVLGIVIHVEQIRQVSKHNGQPLDVRKVVILDHSHDQVVVVTAWADLAISEFATLHSIAASFPVVGFTTLMSRFKKGFSLSTTHSTSIIFDPQGKIANALHAWGKEHAEFITAKSHHVFEVRSSETNRTITTIDKLIAKKFHNTLQEERHWLHVKLPDFHDMDVRLYHGCSSCGTGNHEELGITYTCAACIQENVTSTARLSMTFVAADKSGCYTFTAFTESSEKLVGKGQLPSARRPETTVCSVLYPGRAIQVPFPLPRTKVGSKPSLVDIALRENNYGTCEYFWVHCMF